MKPTIYKIIKTDDNTYSKHVGFNTNMHMTMNYDLVENLGITTNCYVTFIKVNIVARIVTAIITKKRSKNGHKICLLDKENKAYGCRTNDLLYEHNLLLKGRFDYVSFGNLYSEDEAVLKILF